MCGGDEREMAVFLSRHRRGTENRGLKVAEHSFGARSC